jgi:hypothetical protein
MGVVVIASALRYWHTPARLMPVMGTVTGRNMSGQPGYVESPGLFGPWKSAGPLLALPTILITNPKASATAMLTPTTGWVGQPETVHMSRHHRSFISVKQEKLKQVPRRIESWGTQHGTVMFADLSPDGNSGPECPGE